MTRATTIIALLVAMAWPAGTHAQGSAPQEAAPRLHLRLILGEALMWGSTDSRYPIISERQELSPAIFTPYAGLGVVWSPFRHVSIGLLGRAFLLPMELGRTRALVEALALPQVHVPFPRLARSRICLGLPVGVVWTSQSQDSGRAVREDWAGRAGLSMGATIGIEFWLPKRRWGALAELGYQARFFSADVTSTLVDSPGAEVKDRVAYRDHQILISIGLLLGFL